MTGKLSANPPVYSQVAFDIAVKIAAGELQEGERFTGRSLTSSQYGVSSETIRRALGMLEEMGILSVQVHVGYTVLSQKRAIEYVEEQQASKDLRRLKHTLRRKVEERDSLNQEIEKTVQQILDLSERFRFSDRIRTYEFVVQQGSSVVGKSIGMLQFRQKTGATVVAVQRGETVKLSPLPETLLETGDILLVACELSQIGDVSLLLQSRAEGETME